MSERPKLGEQIQAVRTGARVLSGAEKPPSVARQREYLSACADAAADTLAWIQANEPTVRAYIDWMRALKETAQQAEPTQEYLAVDLLRRFVEGPINSELCAEARAFVEGRKAARS